MAVPMLLWCAPIVWGALLLWPVLDLPLMGDDYYWWQLGRAAMARPALLLAPLGQFWRPLATVQWAVESSLWNRWPTGYHATNLALHLACAVALTLVVRRLGMGRWVAAAVGMLWVGSPLTEEPAISVSARHDTQLGLAWLVLILLWPRKAERWTVWRIASVVAVGIGAMLAKESWVATPLLIVGLEMSSRGVWSGALKAAAPWVLGSIVYGAIHAMALPVGGYMGGFGVAVTKMLHELAAFLWLELPQPLGFLANWQEVVALVVVVTAMVAGWRQGRPVAMVGTALLLTAMVPTLFVPYLPTRYTAIPYAGFLLLAADTVVRLAATLRGRWKLVATVVTVMMVALVGVAGAFVLRADLVDWGRVGDAHRRLLQEARLVSAEIPRNEPVAVVRAEQVNPLAEIALSPRGIAKIFFPRPNAPYGLIAPECLFEWVVERKGMGFRRLASSAVAGSPGSVLVHRAYGFSRPLREVSDLGPTLRNVRDRGFPVVVIHAGSVTRGL